MQGFEISVTLKGKTIQEVLSQAQALIDADGAPVAGKRGKKAAAVIEDDDDALGLGGEETETLEDEDGQQEFDMLGGEDEETPPPKKKKISDKDVNDACMKHAKKHGKKVTLGLLKKHFKVQSILELKPEQYPKVIAALKV